MLPTDMVLGSLWVLERVYSMDLVGTETAIRTLNDGLAKLAALRHTMLLKRNEDQIQRYVDAALTIPKSLIREAIRLNKK